MHKKEKVKVIEYHFKYYKTYKIGIINFQKELDNIMPSISTSYSTQEGSCGTFNITSKVETAVLDRLEGARAVWVREQQRELQLIVDSLDEAMGALTEQEVKFMKARYFEGKSMDQTASICGYSEKHGFKIRNQIMDKLFISLSNLLKINFKSIWKG